MPRKLTQEAFIDKAKNIHGDKFDYSQTVYEKAHSRIIVKCKRHNLNFEQIAGDHLKGRNGCSSCNGQTPINKQELIKRSIQTFGDEKFDFDKVPNEFTNGVHSKIELKCLSHNNWFTQEAWSHIQGKNGCGLCSQTKKKTLDDIIYKSQEKLPGKEYDYSQIDLTAKTTEKVIIGCYIKEHGTFEQSLSNHWAGKVSCIECRKQKREEKKNK